MPPDLLDGNSFQGVDDEYARNQIDYPRSEGDFAREGVGPPFDGVVQGGDGRVVEGQPAADERVEDDAAAPDVGLGAGIGMPGCGRNLNACKNGHIGYCEAKPFQKQESMVPQINEMTDV